MKVTRLELKGLLLIELDLYHDSRGYFVERYQQERFAALGLPTSFLQDNHSRSHAGVLRGLHYQYQPKQGKLIGVVRGRIWDVVVDIRPQSKTFGQNLGLELDGESGQLLWIPPGFAHGFCVLGIEPADVIYKVDTPYSASGEGGLHWADPELAIRWPIEEPLVSAKDQRLQSFAAYRSQPLSWE